MEILWEVIERRDRELRWLANHNIKKDADDARVGLSACLVNREKGVQIPPSAPTSITGS